MTDLLIDNEQWGGKAHKPQDSPRFWFVAQTKPRQEQLAKVNLERQGYRVNLPLVYLRFDYSGRRGVQVAKANCSSNGPPQEALFPGYIFFAPGHSKHSIAPVRSTVGVTRLVRFGCQFATLSSELLADVLDIVEDCNRHPSCLLVRLNGVVQGKPVGISKGPFAGRRGIVSEIGTERVKVLLEILGKTQSLGFHPGQLRAV